MESNALTPLDEADFGAIETAVMETARGRWFLHEFARRNRNSDTSVLLEAIGRLEHAIGGDKSSHDIERLRYDLQEMANSISQTKSEISAMRPCDEQPSHLIFASEALDSIVKTTERATSDILEAAEHIQEAAWTLREQNADSQQCDALDSQATHIYTACSFQDLTAQRTAKVVKTLQYLEARLTAMIEIWGKSTIAQASAASDTPPAEPNTPEHWTAHGLSQRDVDLVIIDQDELFDNPDLISKSSSDDGAAIFHSTMVAEDISLVSDDPLLINDEASFSAQEPSHVINVQELSEEQDTLEKQDTSKEVEAQDLQKSFEENVVLSSITIQEQIKIPSISLDETSDELVFIEIQDANICDTALHSGETQNVVDQDLEVQKPDPFDAQNTEMQKPDFDAVSSFDPMSDATFSFDEHVIETNIPDSLMKLDNMSTEEKLRRFT